MNLPIRRWCSQFLSRKKGRRHPFQNFHSHSINKFINRAKVCSIPLSLPSHISSTILTFGQIENPCHWPKGGEGGEKDGFRSGSKRFLAAFPQLANLITETHQAAGWRASYKFTTQYRFIIGPTLAELWGRGRARWGSLDVKVIFHGIGFCEHHHAGLRFVARVRANNRLTFCYSPRGDGIFLNKLEPGESDARLVWGLNINRARWLRKAELEGGGGGGSCFEKEFEGLE